MIIIFNKDLLSIIDSKRNNFTKTEKKIAANLESNIGDVRKIIYLSITELADSFETSEGSIVRFCRKLGFEGFHQFKLYIASQMKHEKNRSKINSFFSNNEFNDLRKEIVQQNLDVIKETNELIDVDELSQAVNTILRAKRIFTVGAGSSSNSALELYYHLMRLGLPVLQQFDAHFQAMITSHLVEKDVLIVFSQSGSTIQMLNIAKIAQQNNVKIIAITSYEKSPLTKLADIVLLTFGKMSPFDTNRFPLIVSQMFVINYLVSSIYNVYENRDEAIQKTAKSVANWIY